MKNSHLWYPIKIALAILAILNLIVLFFFRYHLATIPNEPSGYTSIYLTGSDGANAEIHDKPVSDKERPANYTGPSITLESDLPEINQEDLSRLPSVLHDLDLLSADDGTGKDLSPAVTYDFSHVQDRDFDVTFKVKNTYGDNASKTARITVNMRKPMILLSQDHLTISKGDSFDARDYVEEAIDLDGKDITEFVVTSGTVKTKTSGSYEVEYSVASQEGKSLGTARLTVIVQ